MSDAAASSQDDGLSELHEAFGSLARIPQERWTPPGIRGVGRVGLATIESIRAELSGLEEPGVRLSVGASATVDGLRELLSAAPFPDSKGFSEERVTEFSREAQGGLTSVVHEVADLARDLSRQADDGVPELARFAALMESLWKDASFGMSWELARDQAAEALSRAQGLPYDEGREIARILVNYLDVMEAIDFYKLNRFTAMYYPDLMGGFWDQTKSLWSRGDPSAVRAMLTAATRLRSGVGDAIGEWRDEAVLAAGNPERAADARAMAQQAYGNLGTLGEQLALAQLRAELGQTRAEAEETLDRARESAGVESVGQLIAGFGEFSKRETQTADMLRRSTIGLSLLTVAAAVVVAFAFEVDTAAELAKLAWTLPLAGLAAYCGRESARHRSSADWAKVLDVQLKAIDNFCASLGANPQMSLGLRVAFGHHVFLSTLPDHRGDGEVRGSNDLVRAVQQVAELTGAVDGPQRKTSSAVAK
ncbi:hypothetical protein [Baekduia sp. Peel2402]|uniref:hypothetical protein n=1 Tax=Baekduia sp. Peel2402 TaxID=3458296 RepID=UPI00403E7BFB